SWSWQPPSFHAVDPHDSHESRRCRARRCRRRLPRGKRESTAMPDDARRRDLVGQQIVDYEARVDVARLKRERLARLQAEVGKAGLGAVLLYDPINIRYATGTRDSSTGFALRSYYRYAVVPRQGHPIVFGGLEDGPAGEAAVEVREGRTWDFFPCGRNVDEAARRWAEDLAAALGELGVAREPLGIDRLDFVGFEALRARHLRLAAARVPAE